MWVFLSLVLMITAPYAATPVVVDGAGLEAAAAEVSARTGLPRDQLEPLDIAKLLDKPPQVVGQAVLRRCVQEPMGMEPARAELARAVAAQQSGDPVGALDHLDLAVASLGCLSELVDRATAARIFLLRGAILSSQREIGDARSEFRTAVSFDPELAWHDGLPDAGHAALVEERDRAKIHRIRAMPGALVSGPWLGGQVVEEEGLEVSDGLFLVQYASPAGIRSAWLVVSGDATLIIPGGYRSPVLENLADPARRREVELLLAATLPEFVAAYAHEGTGGTWLVIEEQGELQTTELVPPPPAQEPEEPKRRRKRQRR
jgi:hypothetical protein